MRGKLQFTLFAKILALTSTVVFSVLFYFHHYISELFATYLVQTELRLSLFWMTYFTAGIIAIGLSISSYLVALSVTTPIRKLAKLTSLVSKGDFNISKQSIYPLPSDEIGELSRHFIAMARELEKRQRSQNLLQKLHGQKITDKFLQGVLDNQAVLKNVSVMFIDIRQFTKFAEDKSPSIVLDELNHFFEQCGKVVLEHGGVIDKFMGDSMMAVWGVLDELDQKESNNKNALACALAINSLELGFKIGIGLHCGPAILGGVGTTNQRDYTVIGDTVNTAARLQQATRIYETSLVVSRQVVDEANLQNKPHFTRKDLELQGKQKKVTVYTYESAISADAKAIKAA